MGSLSWSSDRGNSSFLASILDKLRDADKISLICVDEAHCVSEWGLDFRPEFRQLSLLKKRFPNVPLMAATASATAHCRTDICKILFNFHGAVANTVSAGSRPPGASSASAADHPPRAPVVLVDSFNRRNLFLEVRDKTDDYLDDVVLTLRREEEKHRTTTGFCAILYVLSQKEADQTALDLRKKKIQALSYHAGLALSVRQQNQEHWQSGKAKVMCATVAFGMGIDKQNCRFVGHLVMPKSLENYYQEVGRAGRDGNSSNCVCWFSSKDYERNKRLVMSGGGDNSGSNHHIFLRQLEAVRRFLSQGVQCRRRALLEYFGEALLWGREQAGLSGTKVSSQCHAVRTSGSDLRSP